MAKQQKGSEDFSSLPSNEGAAAAVDE